MFKFLKKIVTRVVDGVKSIAHKIGNFIKKHDSEIVTVACVTGVAAVVTGYFYYLRKANNAYSNYLESRKSTLSLDNIPISDMGVFGNKLSEMVGGNVNNIETAFFGFRYT